MLSRTAKCGQNLMVYAIIGAGGLTIRPTETTDIPIRHAGVLIQMVNVCPDRQGTHLAVADKQQPNPVNDLQHSVYRRFVELVIGDIASHHLAHQGHPKWVERSYHDLDLLQRRVVFAIAIFKEAVFAAFMVTGHCGGVQPHLFGVNSYTRIMLWLNPFSIAYQVSGLLNRRSKSVNRSSVKSNSRTCCPVILSMVSQACFTQA